MFDIEFLAVNLIYGGGRGDSNSNPAGFREDPDAGGQEEPKWRRRSFLPRVGREVTPVPQFLLR